MAGRGAETHEGIEVHGRAKGAHHQAGGGWHAWVEVCRKAGISTPTFFNWKQKYVGLMPSEMKRLRELDQENTRLKKIVADLALDKEML